MTRRSTTVVPPPPAHTTVVVRSLLAVKPEEREQILKDVEFNVFAFPAGLLTCDFLSDSGTSAMTDLQWAACKPYPTILVSLLSVRPDCVRMNKH